MDVLGGGHGVRRGQQAVDDAELLVHDVDQGRCAVGRARSVRHHRHGLLVAVEVHAPHEHRDVGARSTDDHFFRTRRQVFLRTWYNGIINYVIL